jgi:hypothetical protein
MNKEKMRKLYPYPTGVQPIHSSYGYFAVLELGAKKFFRKTEGFLTLRKKRKKF